MNQIPTTANEETPSSELVKETQQDHQKNQQEQQNEPSKNGLAQKGEETPLEEDNKNEKADLLLKTKIFIGGIPSHFTKEDLLEYFKTFGEVLSLKLKTKKKNANVNLGFGTITVDKEIADKILVTNFHYIKDRKIECQRFVKSNKSRSKLIKDKKLKTLYINHPPESMNEQNMKAFFAKFGKIENAYILPERRIPVPSNPKNQQEGGEPVIKKPTKYEVLKKKVLILFETIQVARAVHQKSQQGGVVFEGEVVKLDYKWPEEVERILKKEKEEEEARRKNATTQSQSKDSETEEPNQQAVTKEVKRPEASLFPIPILTNKQKKAMESKTSQKKSKKTQSKEKGTEKKKKLRRTPTKTHEGREQQQQEEGLSQAELLRNLPLHLQRTMKPARPPYFPGFWGILFQKEEERRRNHRPYRKEYNHTECEPNHDGYNIRLKMSLKRNSLLIQSLSQAQYINANNLFTGVQFQRMAGPNFTLGARFNSSFNF